MASDNAFFFPPHSISVPQSGVCAWTSGTPSLPLQSAPFLFPLHPAFSLTHHDQKSYLPTAPPDLTPPKGKGEKQSRSLYDPPRGTFSGACQAEFTGATLSPTGPMGVPLCWSATSASPTDV